MPFRSRKRKSLLSIAAAMAIAFALPGCLRPRSAGSAPAGPAAASARDPGPSSDDGRGPSGRLHPEAQQVDPGAAVLSRSISGRVLDHEGQPVRDAEVSAAPLVAPGRGGPPGIGPTVATRTDDAGRFTLEGLADGEYELSVSVSDASRPTRRSVMAPAEGIDIILLEEARLIVQGTVVTADGAPIDGALVLVSGQRGRATTSAEGAFQLELSLRGAPGEVVTFSARKSGYVRGKRSFRLEELAGRGEVEVSIELTPLGEFGVVLGKVAGGDGRPVAGESVYLRSAEHGVRYRATTAADGSFRVPEVVTAKDYRLWIYPRQGYCDRVLEPLEVQTGENRVDVELEPLGSCVLNGVLLDPTGRPVPRLTFTVRSARAFASSVVGTTDDAGRFRLERVPSGNLVLETRTLPRLRVHGIRVEDGGEATVEIPVGIGAERLEGRVVSRQGEAVTGARVTVTWNGRSGSIQSSLGQETVTSPQGRFSVSGLGKGSCVVQVTARGYRPARRAIRVPSPTDDGEVTIELERVE